MTYGPIKEVHLSAAATVTVGGPIRCVGAFLTNGAAATGTFLVRNTSATGAVLLTWAVPGSTAVQATYPGMGLLCSVVSQIHITTPTSGFINFQYT